MSSVQDLIAEDGRGQRGAGKENAHGRSPWQRALAERVRFAMGELGLTAVELSLRCGLSHVYVTHLLSGRIGSPRIDSAKKLMAGIGCSGNWLLSGKGAPPKLEKAQRERKLYFVRRESDGAIKIGTSVSVACRLMNLQSGAGDRMTLLATRPGGFAEEASLHKRFAASCVRGEWFAPTEELLALINSEAA